MSVAGPAPADDARDRGAFYTPESIVDFLVDWAMAGGARRVLEPSAGDGRFVVALGRHGPEAVDAVEIDPASAERIRARHLPGVNVHQADAFTWYQPLFGDHHYDAVVGNPPFVGYHGFRGVSRGESNALLRAEGIEPSDLMNAWVPFVVLACRVLRRGGRLAMVLPGELLCADYARPLRRYLTRRLSRMLLVTFRTLVFPGVTQETVLVLGIAGAGTQGAAVSVAEIASAADLASLDPERGGHLVTADPGTSWSSLGVDAGERALLDAVVADLFVPLGRLATIDVGIVTGANRFFCLSADEVAARGLWASMVRLAPRSVPGISCDEERFLTAVEEGQPCFLFSPQPRARSALSAAERAYVEAGEAAGVQRGYKCSLRLPAWWRLERRTAPGALFARHVAGGPRMIVNTAGVVSEGRFMDVRPRPGVEVGALAAGLHNSATYAMAELTWHGFGGGVLGAGPTAAEALPVPAGRAALDPERIDALVATGDVEAALRFVDEQVLVAQGVSRADAARLRRLAQALRARRVGRR